MRDHDESAMALSLLKISPFHRPHQFRFLHEIPGGHNETGLFDLNASNSIDNQNDAENGINNLPTELNFRWVMWLCLGLLVAYLLYRAHHCLLRRARILRSENAMDHLGDLQMLPSEDFSHSDPDYAEEDEQRDNDLL